MGEEESPPSGYESIDSSETAAYEPPDNDAVNFQVSGTIFPQEVSRSKSEIEEVLAEFYESEEWSPPSGKGRVWRYLDLTQLLSIIEREKLWFTEVGEFNDPYEGTLPKQNLDSQVDRLRSEFDFDEEVAKKCLDWYRADMDPEHPNVNCWNLGEKDSAALWGKYAPEGVAIQTSVEDLKSSLQTEVEVVSGKVQYANYQQESIPDGKWSRIFYKRLSFRHEDEFRLAITEEPTENTGEEGGNYVNVDVDQLIDTVYISPTSKKWTPSLIKNVIGKYEIDCEVKLSDIYSAT